MNPDPVMVTVVPAGPLLGVTDVTVGSVPATICASTPVVALGATTETWIDCGT